MPFVRIPNIRRVDSVGQVEGSSIGARVPYLGVDALYWPQIAGQSFPPVLAGSAAYNVDNGIPTISLPGAGSTATYPYVPRLAGELETVTVAGVIHVHTLGSSTAEIILTGVEGIDGPIAGFRLAASGALSCVTVTAGGTPTVQANLLTINTADTYTWSVQLRADGSVVWTFGGVSFTGAAGLIPTSAPVRVWLSSSVGRNFEVGPVAVTYAA